MLTSLVPAGGRLLVIENGAYGERMSQIAALHGIEARALRLGWGAAIPLARVEEALAAAQEPPTHVAVVHHETSTGRLNDLEALGALCRRLGAALLVDAVSSFGAEPLEAESWGLQACAATANKCLHGAAGVAFVIAARSALAAGSSPARTLVLDLRRHCAEQDRGSTLFTPALPAFYALLEALEELRGAGGWRARAARYRELAERVRCGLAQLGVAPYLAPEQCSVALRSYVLEPPWRYERLHDELKKRGFVIYAGQDHLRERLFRISTMGEISDSDVVRLLRAFREIRCSPAPAMAVS
jgi:2-aminoethylphosphonate-pyruvate transaminase